ncbi:ATP-binding protein [uncultured Sunxiuqinia sp.]|uniref:sensor histidine kinase n=1 Tax=uncultured Sunxiuqinia sp. TaxID=1573825 RepID=UPI002AA83381|nr:ATP-binding protein [uncultured Sunxiuqinia sp.]
MKERQQKITALENELGKQRNIEQELRAANQQLDAANQQLQASEQQLKALTEQLTANERELIEKEEIARSARDYAENIIATVRDPLIVLDGSLRVVSASRSFYTTFKTIPEKTEGKLFYELDNGHWDAPALKMLLNEVLPEKSTMDDYEVEHDFKRIGKKIMLINARELLQERGKNRLILLSIQDITKRRAAERDLLILNSELEAKTNELQQILYITTHDLRSPLVNIQGFNRELEASLNELTKLLKNVELPDSLKLSYNQVVNEEIPEAMHFIRSSADKMDGLLRGLLSLSRLGRQKIIFSNLDMNKLMHDVIENYEYKINESQVEIDVSDLPHCQGDELQINQLFSNLIDNAMKFFDPKRPGKIKISGEQENEFSKYTVEDNGIGIHSEHQQKVFELFHKLNPEKSGIGLGMNIVKQVVEKHSGKIILESTIGIGTKFIILLPKL